MIEKQKQPYVEVRTRESVFEKRTLKLGTSDNVNVEILEGVVEGDEIKVWNKVSKKDDENENE